MRNIPAHAGKTRLERSVDRVSPEHPRARGENGDVLNGQAKIVGTSPRTRGKPAAYARFCLRPGNIPAHAGKTHQPDHRRTVNKEHPRARGENRRIRRHVLRMFGTSPRTRGKLRLGFNTNHIWGNIPAHAGKTPPVKPPLATPVGTSPRTRGKPLPTVSFHTPPGNIPAHAGKTASWTRPVPAMGEHPRARGENSWVSWWMFSAMGTSPRTRGKQPRQLQQQPEHRNIPAHAGKTITIVVVVVSGGEHPRARGENPNAERKLFVQEGTSPRTRGKPHRHRRRQRRLRNIPAHAGKTASLRALPCLMTEHPRARGENPDGSQWGYSAEGTSPRTRGKHVVVGYQTTAARNIPAHAGKTKYRFWVFRRAAEHPRARGENFGVERQLFCS